MGNHQRHHDEHPSTKEDRHEDEKAVLPFLQSLARSAVHAQFWSVDRGCSALRLERELELLGGMQARVSTFHFCCFVSSPDGTARLAGKSPESLSPLFLRKLLITSMYAMYDWDGLQNERTSAFSSGSPFTWAC